MVTYTDLIEGITPKNLQGFFVGWMKRPSPETHYRILRESDHIVLAVDDETDNVVGFVTAHSDGVLSAYIPLLEVLPEYQGQGIGQQLMRRMLDKLKHLYMVDLTCDPDRQSFYLRVGMRRSTGMMIRNFARQSGTETEETVGKNK